MLPHHMFRDVDRNTVALPSHRPVIASARSSGRPLVLLPTLPSGCSLLGQKRFRLQQLRPLSVGLVAQDH